MTDWRWTRQREEERSAFLMLSSVYDDIGHADLVDQRNIPHLLE